MLHQVGYKIKKTSLRCLKDTFKRDLIYRTRKQTQNGSRQQPVKKRRRIQVGCSFFYSHA